MRYKIIPPELNEEILIAVRNSMIQGNGSISGSN
jgi:hypothetical protein